MRSNQIREEGGGIGILFGKYKSKSILSSVAMQDGGEGCLSAQKGKNSRCQQTNGIVKKFKPTNNCRNRKKEKGTANSQQLH